MTSVVTDPIADLLTRLRNANMVRKASVELPTSKLKVAVVRILKDEGFVRDFEVVKGEPQPMLRIHLLYRDRKEPALSGLKRVSKPGLRVYVGRQDVPRVMGGLGLSIVSTPQGVMTGHEAYRRGIGGELLCQIW